MLRRLLSAVLLVVFLFNLGGYSLFFAALRVKASSELSAQLDRGAYDQQETIEVTVPLSLPYPIQGAGFERSKQFFTIGDDHYQVIKHKYENDVLTIVCIKDKESSDITNIMQSMDEQQSGEEGQSVKSAKSIQDFMPGIILYLLKGQVWSHDIGQKFLIAGAESGWQSSLFSPPKLS